MIIDPYNWRTVDITNVEHVAKDTVSVTCEKPKRYRFIAGQYTIVRVKINSGSLLIRQYSFVSSPDDRNITFLVRLKPKGQVSSWFYHSAEANDMIEIAEPLGSFTPIDSTPLLFIAGGVGIAPFMSMLRTNANNSSLIYCENNPDKACYITELRTLLDSRHLNMQITSTSGRLNHTAINRHLSKDTIIYLCGSKLFVDEMARQLNSLHVAPERIKRELFTLQ